ncbi:hypothetical protein DY000_02046643 [Brassica cretica]|uniref:S1 motif domain-containing protein n=1 Tax=Brassica cretica TaxID=69181 RepID=A0ABQ7ERF8_BRACR|nr:hypothetical protein DY000_02046643 [Brassica cretica]
MGLSQCNCAVIVMATVSSPSLSKAGLIPGTAFTVKKNDYSIKCCFWRNAGQKQAPSSAQRLVLPLSTSLKLFPTHGRQLVLHPHRTPTTTTTTSQSRGTARAGRKSEMPSVKNEELVAGATFTGKVRAIQPFGAFVDFGAFTDGLVHVSQLSDTFVKDVASVVTLGQEVKVRLVEADIEAKRISLTMRENDDSTQSGGGGGDTKPRGGGKRNASKGGQRISSKYVKGQMLDGTVKNLTRSGAFITIGEGEEGFLPTNEEADEGVGSMMMGGGSSLQAGQEVKVRVLRIARGRVTLTMKEEDDGKFDETLSQGVVHTATNPFVLAFGRTRRSLRFLTRGRKKQRRNQPNSWVEVQSTDRPSPVHSNEPKAITHICVTSRVRTRVRRIEYISSSATGLAVVKLELTVAEEERESSSKTSYLFFFFGQNFFISFVHETKEQTRGDRQNEINLSSPPSSFLFRLVCHTK